MLMVNIMIEKITAKKRPEIIRTYFFCLLIFHTNVMVSNGVKGIA